MTARHPSPQQQQDGRRTPRIPTDLPARLALAAGPDLSCRALNVSTGGAMLAIADSVPLPDQFDAAIGEMELRSCRLVWRDAGKVGIAWI